MNVDCHIHMVLDGLDWKNAIARHANSPDRIWIRKVLADYQHKGITYLRDGGDRWGVGAAARTIAHEYDIIYKTPLSPLHKSANYGSFIGQAWTDLNEYATLVSNQRKLGADFIKIMISGLMDFNNFGVLTSKPLSEIEIRELVHIAHEEGFPVMAHCNGARTAEIAAVAKVDSIEHGAYLDQDAMNAMKENRTIWVPTLSTIANLRGRGRFDERVVERIYQSAIQNVFYFASIGGYVALGSDSGAWAVPHGVQTEYLLLHDALGGQTDSILNCGNQEIMNRF